MASSRKPPAPDPVGSLAKAVAAALAQRLSSFERPRIAVAYSGGCDSSVLLDVLARLRAAQGFELFAFHVHHGLSPHADAWAEHACAVARRLEVACEVSRVQIERRARRSLEADARAARYAALDALCLAHAANVLALAHHADDQAETVLLQLARGAGLPGLAAMPVWADHVPAARWRPLLGTSGAALRDYARAAGLDFVEDESNADLKLRRNALRHEVIPALVRHVPGAVGAIGRSARHVQSALALAQEVGAADLASVRAHGRSADAAGHGGGSAGAAVHESESADAAVREGGSAGAAVHDGEPAGAAVHAGVSLAALAALTPARRMNALRAWIASLGLPAPSDARLDELWRQAQGARANGQPVIEHAGGRFMRHRDRLCHVASAPVAGDVARIDWTPGLHWRPPGWSGEFRFAPAPQGLDAALLRAAPLAACARHGGERLGIAANRPARDLKHWYQALAVPVWQREAAPLLWLGERLAYVPGVGLAHELVSAGADRWTVEWCADRTGAKLHV